MKNRISPRAQRHNYAAPWCYFITTCTKNRIHYFGNIIDKHMHLSQIWTICQNEIEIMKTKRPTIRIDEYIIMPDHVHMLLIIADRDVGLPRPVPWRDKPRPVNDIKRDTASGCPYGSDNNNDKNDDKLDNDDDISYNNDNEIPHGDSNIYNQSLWSIIWWRKSAVSRQCTKLWIPFGWQTRYHDSIVRDQAAYERIKKYIQQNPANRK